MAIIFYKNEQHLMNRLKMNEARISITPYCNYKCFFCHNEGLAKNHSPRPQIDQLQHLLSELIAFGYNDLTFTGGEPFLFPDLIVDVLSWMSKVYNDNLPFVTIVSNGSLIKEEHLIEIKKYPRLKLHISLHTSRSDKYLTVTRQKHHPFEKISHTLQLLKDLHFDYKINYVLLKGINTGEDELWQSIALAEKYRAKAIKFLELLVRENNAWLFPYFFDIKSAEAIIGKRATHIRTHNRRKIYQKDHSPIEIELQQLTCKIGCNKCLQNRDHTFSARLQYFPCMEASNSYFDLRKIKLEEALENGKKIIKNLSKKYGDRSPSLVQETRYTHSRKELFFKLSKEMIDKLLKRAVLLEQNHFKDWYYRPRTADQIWEEKQQQIKIRLHYTNEYQAKIIGSTVILEENSGIQYQRVIYWDDEREVFVGELDKAFRFMEGLDMVCWYEGEVILRSYRLGKVELSVSEQGNNTCIVGINLNSFKDLKEAKSWLTAQGLPLKGRRLSELLVSKERNRKKFA